MLELRGYSDTRVGNRTLSEPDGTGWYGRKSRKSQQVLDPREIEGHIVDNLVFAFYEGRFAGVILRIEAQGRDIRYKTGKPVAQVCEWSEWFEKMLKDAGVEV